MLKITDINKLKITNVRDWRINFKYDGVQYSLNCHEDGFESITNLTNWDTKEVVCSEYGNLYVHKYIKVSTYYNYNKPLIYSHIDKKHFIKMLHKNGFVDGGVAIERTLLLEKINILNEEINTKKLLLDQYLIKLLELEEK